MLMLSLPAFMVGREQKVPEGSTALLLRFFTLVSWPAGCLRLGPPAAVRSARAIGGSQGPKVVNWALGFKDIASISSGRHVEDLAQDLIKNIHFRSTDKYH